MKEKFYITTAISYPNGAPHIGHAYEVLATDALARFKRLDGYDVMFLTGTDEHGQKIEQTAGKQGRSAAEFVDEMAQLFKDMVAELGCSNDDFIRTTEARHKKTVTALWKRLEEAGDIYLSKYAGWYSVRDEAFYGEDEIEDRGGKKFSTKTDTPVEWVEEESYFFRLSAYQDKLLKLYADQPDFIGPSERRNEVMSFVKGGLQDLSVSRTTFGWGIPVPGAKGHIIYVWLDALINYLSATGWPDKGPRNHYWPADIHIIGKDIVRFHAVYWPAFLMSAGLTLPKRVFGHGFLFNRGEKMSKSVGNVISPAELVGRYGVDQVRYFFLREVPFGQDGNYSHEAIIARINADLSNDLGNLAQRSLSMIGKNCAGKVPVMGPLSAEDQAILAATDALLAECRTQHDVQAINKALDAIWKVVADANRYFASQEPWALKKTDPERMGTVLYVTAEIIRQVGILVQPYMPASAARLLDLLAVPADRRDFSALGSQGRLASGTALPAPQGVFPRYVEEAESSASA
ncbi:methionine--tRNA ligase [Nordella sp. HKS 07]|uniref:methionine--tRNA ligase n=1 Tax=Nordella sp. HKS 07 TaxID=2712222 RepID=UPI0013E16B32|nr:methionine--tRNA ligase [Nordella sp. HKS 07]QIG51331.1 methionine--tRNA ligase [Nordella sp. HKS 07]